MRNFASIDAAPLRAALKLCSAVIERRNTYPILGMVRLSMRDDGTLTIDATDLDIFLSQKLPVRDGAGTWSTCVPVAGLANIAWLATGGGVIIEPRAEESVEVSLDQIDLFSSASYSLISSASDSFPEIEGEPDHIVEEFGNGRLAQLLGRVSWAMSSDDTRYYLNGVAWQSGPFGRRVAATDGHRLAICTYDREQPGNAIVSRLLPAKLVGLIVKLGGAAELKLRDLKMKSDHPAVEIGAGDTLVRARLIDPPSAGYPDIDRVVPRPHSFTASFSPKLDSLDAAITGALALAPRKGGGRFIKFERDDSGLMAVSSHQPDYGTSKIVLGNNWPEGGVPFGVNARYLREVLRSCAGPLKIHQVAATAPITILDEDETMLRVLMPMRA